MKSNIAWLGASFLIFATVIVSLGFWHLSLAAGTTLTLELQVINDNGGTAAATDWTLSAHGPVSISGPTGSAAITNANVPPGTYDISAGEFGGPIGYGFVGWVFSGGIQGDPATGNGPIILAEGESATCVMTMDDLQGELVVEKDIANDGFGIFPVTGFSFKINGGPTIPFEADRSNDMYVNWGTYSIVEQKPKGPYVTTYESRQNGELTGNSHCSSLKIENAGSASCFIRNYDLELAAKVCKMKKPPEGYTLVSGTTGNDNVTLATFTMFVGRGGKDTVTAGDGSYIICTGAGNDTISVGEGGAIIYAGDGNNKIKATGYGGRDIQAGSGNDKITTEGGYDTINAGGGNNEVSSGAGNDIIISGTGNDEVTAGDGDDVIDAGNGKNTVKSGSGNDTVTTGSGNDYIDGGSDTDSCNAGRGKNTFVSCP